MNGLIDSKIFNMLLLITIIGEFLLPWILKHFYNGYDSKKMVMSVLGSPQSPVRKIYNGWLVWLGIFLVIAAFAIYYDARLISPSLAVATFVSIVLFAIGAGVLAGAFSVNESKDVVTLASKIHGAGSAIGFMALMLFPLFTAIIAFKAHDLIMGFVCAAAFVAAMVFFVFFIMGDKKEFQNTMFSYEGLWERLSLFFMYIPFLYIAVKNLFIGC